MKTPGTLGLILAGGASRRFGGRNKAWLRFAGRPMICEVQQRFSRQVDDLVVSSNRHHWAYRHLGMRTIPDESRWRGRGPLAAIATVMNAMRPERLALVPVDMPCIPHDLVSRLIECLASNARAAAASDGPRRQPLCCVLDGNVVGSALLAVERDPLPSMQSWLESIGVQWVPFEDRQEAFININDASDLARYGNDDRTCIPD